MNGKTTILIVIIIVLSVLIVYRYENQEEKPPIAIEGVNTYVDKEVTDRTMASVYFTQFNNMLLNNPSKAYTLIDVTTKTSLNVSNEEEFIEETKSIITEIRNKYVVLLYFLKEATYEIKI